jgi:hypothetical protein
MLQSIQLTIEIVDDWIWKSLQRIGCGEYWAAARATLLSSV